MDYRIKNATTEIELEHIFAFADKIFGKTVSEQLKRNRKEWIQRMARHPELMLYIESEGEIIATVISFVEENGSITIGCVAVDERFRKQGITKELMLLTEERAKVLDVHLLTLGSVQTAEGFYEKLGYTGQLLIQSEKHSIEELLSLNPGHPVVFTNVYEGKVNQLCLKLAKADRELQRFYETTLDSCYTLTMFWKNI